MQSKIQKLDVNDAGMFKRILNYSNRNPWLYAVYVVVIGLPLVLIITFCCSGSKAPPTGDDAMQDPKKTDEVQDDDDLEQAEDQEEVDEDEAEEEGSEEDAEASDDNAELIPEASENKKSSPRRRKVRKD